MYEDRTQNYDQKFRKNISYMTHPFPCHIIYSHVQTSIAINTTVQTGRQQFSAVTESKIWIFKVFLKNLKFGLFRVEDDDLHTGD